MLGDYRTETMGCQLGTKKTRRPFAVLEHCDLTIGQGWLAQSQNHPILASTQKM